MSVTSYRAVKLLFVPLITMFVGKEKVDYYTMMVVTMFIKSNLFQEKL